MVPSRLRAIKRLPRRVLLTSVWVPLLAILLLVWLYVYRYGGLLSSLAPPLPVIIGFGSTTTTSLSNLDIKTHAPELGTHLLPTTTTTTASTSTTSAPAAVTVTVSDATPTPSTTTPLPPPAANVGTPPIIMPTANGGPSVSLSQGTYVGVTLQASRRFRKPIEAFRGVPFAQTTAGQNRFRPPQPLAPSNGSFSATSFGHSCPVMGVVRKGFGEDCLNANIYRPAGLVDNAGLSTTGEKGRRPLLPVAVYVHGGGFNNGMGIERNMAMFVAWADAPMLGVNFNYRVGALGFLPSALTAREGLLNLGLKDQQMLLEWVKDNIEAFGGDPDNITIMGLSAGAHSIGHHVMYYAQSPKPAPFAKAILESGATTARAVLLPTHPRHLVQFRQFLVAANVAAVAETEVFDRLRELPLETIAKASKAVWDLYEESVTWPFQPVIDGPNDLARSSQANITSANGTVLSPAPALPLIPDLPVKSWRQGKHLHIPVLTGYNTNEGTMFIPPKADTNKQFRAFFKGLIPTFSDADLDALEKLYPDPVIDPSSPYKTVPKGKGRQWTRLDAAYSHYAYICPVFQTAHFLSTASEPSPVYVYRYAATSTWGTANHGDEAPVVAHDIDFLSKGGRSPGLMAISDAMHGAWARFVASKVGSPNYGAPIGAVEWPAFVSPFKREDVSAAGGSAAKRWLWNDAASANTNKAGEAGKGGGPPGDTGRVLVFGAGNDEREGKAGKGRKGTPALVEPMSALELETCRFWWERIELSQGLGKKRGEEGEVQQRARAKL
ncbi:Alpha/Beta hydrolase protein [Bombardia bombarda]|uniref:Alpha/Beta hydrolase protein n=1 Tax=Bombardia bombarda TaxID=252184 RepID=A0AA40CE61_9PEZI|nr:Alpha/Beta hydrolase protein [Bombardia bombarda]